MDLEEFKRRLRALTPGMDQLEVALARLPGGEGLSGGERLAVLRGLERVWHMARILQLLGNYFGERLVFGGGSVVNYIYMVQFGEPPRLTFDIDASWHRKAASKRVLLKEVVEFNRWLEEVGGILPVPLAPKRYSQLYLVEYDAEKDHFPNVLSLRVPVITRHDGRPFYEYLNMKDYRLISELRAAFGEVLGTRDGKVDHVRLEISLDPMPGERSSLRDLFGSSISATITPLELQLAFKLRHKLGKRYGGEIEHNLHDLLKALLDLRLLSYMDIHTVLDYIDNTDIVIQNVEENLDVVVKRARALWTRNYHYVLVRRRYRLKDLVSRVRMALRP